MSRPCLILLPLLGLMLPVDAAAQISGVVSVSTGVAQIGESRVLNGYTDIQVHRAELMLWRREAPLYAAFGFSLGLEGAGTHRYFDGDLDYRARANYLDVSVGPRVSLFRNLALTLGLGPTWLADGYVQAEADHRRVAEEDLSRLGYHVQVGAVATESHGLALHLGMRYRSLRSGVPRGDVIYDTQYGGLEFTAGLGLQFGS